MRRRILNVLFSTMLMATAVIALPSAALAASSGCASRSLRLNFDIKFNGNVDSSGWTRESMSYCWNDPNPSPKGTGPLSGQSATYSYGGGTYVGRSWNNHDLWFNAYDYSYEVTYTFRKLTCDFHVKTEIWIDGANGNAAGKWDLWPSGTCTGWSIVLTSWSS